MSVILSVGLAILFGCGNEEQGFPNPLQIDPLQIEILTEQEETPSSEGSVTGQILFVDSEERVRAYALSSSEYVTFQGSSKRTWGEDLSIFLD